MVNFILNGIQDIVNLLFLAAIIGTIGVFVVIRASVEKAVRDGLPVEQNGDDRRD